MYFLNIKNIWYKVKHCFHSIFNLPLSPSSNYSPQTQNPNHLLTELARNQRIPVKKYSFKQFECSVESDCEIEPRSNKKTKIIRKRRKGDSNTPLHVENLESQSLIPHFVDQNGIELSSISKHSEKDSFGMEDFQEMFKWEFQTKDQIKKTQNEESEQGVREKERKWRIIEEYRFRKKNRRRGIKQVAYQ